MDRIGIGKKLALDWGPRLSTPVSSGASTNQRSCQCPEGKWWPQRAIWLPLWYIDSYLLWNGRRGKMSPCLLYNGGRGDEVITKANGVVHLLTNCFSSLLYKPLQRWTAGLPTLMLVCEDKLLSWIYLFCQCVTPDAAQNVASHSVCTQPIH